MVEFRTAGAIDEAANQEFVLEEQLGRAAAADSRHESGLSAAPSGI